MEKEIKILFDELNEKPIVYHKIYAQITNSITAGLLLSQIVYWDKTMKGNEFYKTDKDWCKELSMGKYELKGAKQKLSELKIVNLKRKSIPAKTYYKLNKDYLIRLITSCGKTRQLVMGKTHNKTMEKPTTTTENTTYNNTKNNITSLSDKSDEDNIRLSQFNNFWNLYNKKIDKPKCEHKWNKLSDKDREDIIKHLDDYVKATPDKQYRKNPSTYLNNKSWENEIIENKGNVRILHDNSKAVLKNGVWIDPENKTAYNLSYYPELAKDI